MTAFKFAAGLLATLNRHSAFSKPAVPLDFAFVKRDSTKRPLATSHYRPTADIHSLHKAAS
jgi:hypothetical protein